MRARVPSRAFTSFAYSMNRIKDPELLMNMHEAIPLAFRGPSVPPSSPKRKDVPACSHFWFSEDICLTCDPSTEWGRRNANLLRRKDKIRKEGYEISFKFFLCLAGFMLLLYLCHLRGWGGGKEDVLMAAV